MRGCRRPRNRGGSRVTHRDSVRHVDGADGGAGSDAGGLDVADAERDRRDDDDRVGDLRPRREHRDGRHRRRSASSGQWSGAGDGAFSFSNGNKTVTVTPMQPFSAGEMVFVNLSHDMIGADTTPLRSRRLRLPVPHRRGGERRELQQLDVVLESHRRRADAHLRRLGGRPQQRRLPRSHHRQRGQRRRARLPEPRRRHRPVSARCSPPQDDRRRGEPATSRPTSTTTAISTSCVSATSSQSVWILLGAGDGTFSSITEIPVGGEPHGIEALDVDGDGDLDIVNANVGSDNLALLINNGTGVFGAPTYFDGGVNGEYGLAAADMNGDGITDLVVGGRNGAEIITMLGNGNGTFTAAGTAQPSGGSTWVVVVGDVDGDGDLDAAAANDGSGTIGVLLGQGDGTLRRRRRRSTSARTCRRSISATSTATATSTWWCRASAAASGGGTATTAAASSPSSRSSPRRRTRRARSSSTSTTTATSTWRSPTRSPTWWC